MAETRYISDHYAELAQQLVDTEPSLAHIRDSDATICYLGSDNMKRSKGRTVFGECERVADKNKWAIPADFLVVVYEPNCEGMDDVHLSRLLFHELLHVGIGEDKDGNEVYSIVPHDMEDFRKCVDRWGVDWIAS